MISSMSVPICNHLYAVRANSVKKRFLEKVSLSTSFEVTPFTYQHQILSRNTKDSKLSYNENQRSLFYLGFDRYHDVTDRTDGQTDKHQDRINELP